MRRVRVPAQNVLHIFRPLRPGQIRGRPWITAGMVKMYQLDQYDDFELERKKAAALLMGFVKKGLNTDAQVGEVLPGASPPDKNGLSGMVMEPSIQLLPDGMDITFNQPADVGPNYEAFQVRNLYALCAALGLPYHAVTGDVSRANYSSLRAALIEVRRRIEQFQNEVMVYQLCRPIWERFCEAAVLAGGISLPGYARDPREATRAKWIPPRWDWVDPLKDMQAEKLAVDSGFKSRSDVIEAEGEDPVHTDQRIAQDREREDEMGISFSVGYTSRPDQPTGKSDVEPQPQPPTEGDETPVGAGPTPAPEPPRPATPPTPAPRNPGQRRAA
jgi:lambda family phage portal protein